MNRGRRAALVAAVGSLLWLHSHAALAADPATLTWTVDGVTRRGFVYAPAVSTSAPAPLVLSFHGHGDWIQNFQYTNLHLAWPEAVVVYLQGLPIRTGLPGWQAEKGVSNDRDLRLVDEVVASLVKSYNVDATRIYATGFSNGGMFTYLLWAERPDVFAAFAPVAARVAPSIQPVEPRPLFHIAGQRDPVIRLRDQERAIELAKRVNGVTAKGAACGRGCTTYDSGRAPVMTWIHPGDHEYPDGTAERIAAFLRVHILKAGR